MFGRSACLVGPHRWVERLDGRETYTVFDRCGHEKEPAATSLQSRSTVPRVSGFVIPICSR
jgi:hypothetical protein